MTRYVWILLALPVLFLGLMGLSMINLAVFSHDQAEHAMKFMAVLIAAFVLYFMPLWIALSRRHRNAFAIGLVNFLFGWTVIGWFGSLVWSVLVDKRT